jgi:hypothetical protein
MRRFEAPGAFRPNAVTLREYSRLSKVLNLCP